MRHHVMQVPGDAQPLLAGPAAWLLLEHGGRRARWLRSADQLGDRQQGDQAGRRPERGGRRGVAAADDQGGRPSDVADDQQEAMAGPGARGS